MKTKTENERHTEENLRPVEAAEQKAGSKLARYPEDGTGIDEQKQSNKARADSQALNLALLNSTNDMVWSVDPETFGLVTFNGRILTTNRFEPNYSWV